MYPTMLRPIYILNISYILYILYLMYPIFYISYIYPTMLMPSQAFIAVKLDTTGRLERNLQVQNRGLLIDFTSFWFHPKSGIINKQLISFLYGYTRCKFKIGDYFHFSLVSPVARCEEIEHCCDAKHYPAICICCEPYLINWLKCFYHWNDMWLKLKSVRTLQEQRSSPAKMRGRTKWLGWFLKSFVLNHGKIHYYMYEHWASLADSFFHVIFKVSVESGRIYCGNGKLCQRWYCSWQRHGFLKLCFRLMNFFGHIVVIWLSSGLNNTKPTKPWHIYGIVCKYDWKILKDNTRGCWEWALPISVPKRKMSCNQVNLLIYEVGCISFSFLVLNLGRVSSRASLAVRYEIEKGLGAV